jgi:hypothetical protein
MKGFSLATISHNGDAVPAIEVDGNHYDLRILAPSLIQNSYGKGLMALFQDWTASEQPLLQISSSITSSSKALIQDVKSDAFMTPLQYPRKLIV